MLKKFLNIVDGFYRWFRQLETVGSIFYMETRVYNNDSVNLSDGTTLRRGDKVCVLHFNSERIALMHSESKGNAGFSFVRHVTFSLSELAKKLYNDKAYEEIVALGGITWMAREGTKRIGFDRYPVKGFWRLSWLKIKFSLYIRSAGKKQMAEKIEPHAFWMSKARLLSHYN